MYISFILTLHYLFISTPTIFTGLSSGDKIIFVCLYHSLLYIKTQKQFIYRERGTKVNLFHLIFQLTQTIDRTTESRGHCINLSNHLNPSI